MKLYLDTETYSERGINCGVHAYSETGEVMLMPWALDESEVQTIDFTQGGVIPPLLQELLEIASTPLEGGEVDPLQVVFHNSHFDRTMMRNTMGIAVHTSRIIDTMVQAFAHALPGKLGQLCEVLDVPVDKAKDRAGHALIQLFCKPRPKRSKIRRATHATHPSEWKAFVEYARLDVEAMRECHRRMPKVNMSAAEHRLWELDQRINDRGVAVDMELVDAALRALEKEQARLKDETVILTGAQIESTTRRDATILYILQEHGIVVQDLKASTVERLLQLEDLPFGLPELLEIRLQATTTSTAKYKTLKRVTSADGRARGLLQFAGAGRTERWAGRNFQPQNLTRQTMAPEEIEIGIETLKLGLENLL